MRGISTRPPQRILSEINAKLHSPETAAAVAGVESKLTNRRREQKVQSGAFRGMQVVVYRGIVVDDVAEVRVRVTEAPCCPETAGFLTGDTVQVNLRRYAALTSSAPKSC